MSDELKTCIRCVMDESASDIRFDDDGVCNYCTAFEQKVESLIAPDDKAREARLEELVKIVRASVSRNAKYDCIVGVSGGVDSSWALVEAVNIGLRPLAVHMDSGWNSELAQNNISNLVKSLGLDLYTHVINWQEIRGLMQSFFDSDVIDVEVLYDNAMLAVNYQQAKKFNIKYILAGTNIATEGVDIPSNWNWYKSDKKNIIKINKKFNGPKIKTFPLISTLDTAKYTILNRIKWISFLDYTGYRKSDALEVLERDFGYKRYPYKHYESIFTRFFQGYILPVKFGIDKRRPHLSSLIMNDEMTRDEAIALLKDIPYSSQSELDRDMEYFKKKMLWSERDLQDYLKRDEVPHMFYGSERPLYQLLLRMYRRLGLRVGRLLW